MSGSASVRRATLKSVSTKLPLLARPGPLADKLLWGRASSFTAVMERRSLRSTIVYPLGVIGVQIGMPSTLEMLANYPQDGLLVGAVIAPYPSILLPDGPSRQGL